VQTLDGSPGPRPTSPLAFAVTSSRLSVHVMALASVVLRRERACAITRISWEHRAMPIRIGERKEKRSMTVKTRKTLVALCCVVALAAVAPAALAGQIVLTGTDIISLHQDHTANYAVQLFALLGQASPKPILVFSNFDLDGNPNYSAAAWAP